MKIIIDNFVPYACEALSPYAEVVALHANEFSPEVVADADALVVRTRTRCNSALLDGSKVALVTTATIGFDHIDTEWCKGQNIEVVSAAGCNARGVLQWVSAALCHALKAKHIDSPNGLTIGVIGVGHVGSLVADYCRSWGFRVLCSDPPRERAEGLTESDGFVPLDELLRESDIVTLHTPLIRGGEWPTFHLADSRFMSLLKPGAVLLNASRGEVADTEALLQAREDITLLLDVWEGEPNGINRALLERAKVATPHIAGYSLQGKANASAIVIRAIAQKFGIEPLTEWYPQGVKPSAPRPISWGEMCAEVGNYCDLEGETALLKSHPDQFDQRRNTYPLREEYF